MEVKSSGKHSRKRLKEQDFFCVRAENSEREGEVVRKKRGGTRTKGAQ